MHPHEEGVAHLQHVTPPPATHHTLHLAVTEAVKKSSKEALEGGEEGGGQRPEGEV